MNIFINGFSNGEVYIVDNETMLSFNKKQTLYLKVKRKNLLVKIILHKYIKDLVNKEIIKSSNNKIKDLLKRTNILCSTKVKKFITDKQSSDDIKIFNRKFLSTKKDSFNIYVNCELINEYKFNIEGLEYVLTKNDFKKIK